MTRFILIRHALTDSVGKSLSGRKGGVPLNEDGKRQAQALAGRLRQLPITAIYSSPLERAAQTAAPIAQQLHVTTVFSEHFLEIDFGDWTGCSFEELQGQLAFQHFNSFRSGTRIPGGESMLQAQARIVTGLIQLAEQHPNEMVAIISHSDMIKAAVAYYAGIHLDMFSRLEISPASVTVVDVYEASARILLLNDTGSLKELGKQQGPAG